MRWLQRLFTRALREPAVDQHEALHSELKYAEAERAVEKLETDPAYRDEIRQRFLKALRESLIYEERKRHAPGD